MVSVFSGLGPVGVVSVFLGLGLGPVVVVSVFLGLGPKQLLWFQFFRDSSS